MPLSAYPKHMFKSGPGLQKFTFESINSCVKQLPQMILMRACPLAASVNAAGVAIFAKLSSVPCLLPDFTELVVCGRYKSWFSFINISSSTQISNTTLVIAIVHRTQSRLRDTSCIVIKSYICVQDLPRVCQFVHFSVETSLVWCTVIGVVHSSNPLRQRYTHHQLPRVEAFSAFSQSFFRFSCFFFTFWCFFMIASKRKLFFFVKRHPQILRILQIVQPCYFYQYSG